MRVLIALVIRLFRKILHPFELHLIRLDERSVDPDPIKQFQQWYRQAIRARFYLAESMALVTASRDGVPSARMVLLKKVDSRGFVFYTN